MLFRTCSIVCLALLILPYADSEQFPPKRIQNTNNGQRITVNGRLLCDGKPLQNVFIQMYEDDVGGFIDPDDLLSEKRTDADGSFNITGEENEYRNIEPYVKISKVHCGASCDEKWSMQVWFGDVPEYSHVRHDFGDIEMANVCANVVAEDSLTPAELAVNSKKLEDYDTLYSKWMELRMQATTKESGTPIGISGQLMCAGKPLPGVKIKIRETYQRNCLNWTHTDASGRFVIFGRCENEGGIMPFLYLYNVNCSTKCTGSEVIDFALSEVSKPTAFDVGTLDLVETCQSSSLVSSLKNYELSGRLTCGGRSLSGVHVTLYEEDTEYSNTEWRLSAVDTNDTGHFFLHRSTMQQRQVAFLEVSGVICGTICNPESEVGGQNSTAGLWP